MSVRLAIASHLRRTTRTALAVGLVVGCAGLVQPADMAAIEPPQPDTTDTVDDRPPLPPDEPKRPPLEAKVRIPGRDRVIFTGTKDKKTGLVKGGIEDEKPLASEKQNPDEYRAWTEVVLHARQFTAAELERYAGRDLTPEDLIHGSRIFFRLDLVRFDGKWLKARRVQPTRDLESVGIKQQYEGWLLPADESPSNVVRVVFTDWPADVPQPPEIAAGKTVGESVPIGRWATVAGYFFKLTTYPGPNADPDKPDGPGWQKAPLLVGRSITPLADPPAAITDPAIDKNKRIFKLIHDDAPLGRSIINWEEPAAWNRVVLHARRFSTEELEQAANHDLKFADLFESHRKDYQLALVYFEGQLIRLKKVEPSRQLAESGITALYEGWLVPHREPRGNPICIVISDLPPGLEPKPLMSVPVTFAGYSFKLLRYESQETRPDDPTRNVWKRAPFLIGHSVRLDTSISEEETRNNWRWGFMPAVVGGVAGLAVVSLAMTWWFRRGDRTARAEIEANRSRNPFTEGTG